MRETCSIWPIAAWFGYLSVAALYTRCGVPTQGLVLAVTVVVALVVVAGMSTIGLLLISAMMVVPVAAAAQIASSYRATMWIASTIGAVSAIAGLLASFYADVPPGAGIVLAALTISCLTSLARLTASRLQMIAAR